MSIKIMYIESERFEFFDSREETLFGIPGCFVCLFSFLHNLFLMTVLAELGPRCVITPKYAKYADKISRKDATNAED